MSMITTSFSIISAAILFGYYAAINRTLNRSWLAMTLCAVLITGLIAVQVMHLNHAQHQATPMQSPLYLFLLFLIPPTFFLFSREVLLENVSHSPWLAAHYIPVGIPLFLPDASYLPVAFAIGAGYCLWFVKFIYGTRHFRKCFHYEIFFFGFFAITSVIVLILSILLPSIDNQLFFLFYSQSISAAFIFITFALIAFPDMLSDLTEAAKLSYSSTTLNGINIDAQLAALKKLMDIDKVYQQDSVNLNSLAELLGLSSHQLSELINTQLHMNFSAYIRYRRIEAAKQQLINEPKASVLSVAMAVGFKSQSNFYVAFKELESLSPGQYRKQHSACAA